MPPILVAPVEGQQLVPPRVGLLATVAALASDDRIAAGIEWEPESCVVGGVYDPDLCGPTPDSIDVPASSGTESARSFVAWGGDRCSPWDQARDWRGRARRNLEATLSYQVAHEFWTGTLATAATPDWPNRFLASQESDTVTDGPTSVTDALACLEQGIAEAGRGRRGMIHATPQLVTHWQIGGALRREGGLILTIMDTIVVADAGYDGSGQYGQPVAEGSVWAYGTELVQVRLGALRYVPDGEPLSAMALDRSVNTVEVRAERDALIQWDHCIHVAAEVNLSLCGIGGS